MPDVVLRAPRRRAAGAVSPAPARADRGSLSLEFALLVPVLFVLLVLVFQALVVARDALAIQHAAGEGARVAATNASDREVVAAVRAALDGRAATVSVLPSFRRAGSLVHVEVTVTSGAPPLTTPLSARASMRVEPVVR